MEQFGSECLQTSDGKNYVGTMNKTTSGKICQEWSSQVPNAHSYDELDYFPDDVSSIIDVHNYCRYLQLLVDVYDEPWCIPAEQDELPEVCRIPPCKGQYTAVAYSYM
jgi:Kringle domain